MKVRVVAISAAAALLLVGVASTMFRGHDDSSATPVPTVTSPAPNTTAAPSAGPVHNANSAAAAGLIASSGPYGDPFDVPAEAAVDDEEGSTAETTAADVVAQAPSEASAPSSAGQTAVVDPTNSGEAQGAPGEPSDSGELDGSSNEETASGEAPSSQGGEVGTAVAPPAVSPPDPAVSTEPVAVLRLVIPGRPPQTVALATKDVLPSRADPLLAVLRLDADRRRAILMLADDVHPEGPARCAPSAARCRTLTMAAGHVQRLTATTRNGELVRYRLRLVAVR